MYRLECFTVNPEKIFLTQWFDSFSEAKDFVESIAYLRCRPYRIIDESAEFIQEVES